MKISRKWLQGLVCAGVCLPMAGQVPAVTLPGKPISPQVTFSQTRAEKAFHKEDFDSAHWHYLKVLAPAGDKYAQYMLGYLNEHGLGVPRNKARAMAWYGLAAERGGAPLEATYERLAGQLSTDDRERAVEIYSELNERYGDRSLFTKEIKLVQRNLRRRTGTRTGASNGPLFILRPDGRFESGEKYYNNLEARIEFMTEQLSGTVTLRELKLIEDEDEE